MGDEWECKIVFNCYRSVFFKRWPKPAHVLSSACHQRMIFQARLLDFGRATEEGLFM